ncbi:MAG: dynamin family protein [Treponema sp.]|jgi:predicted GTPase|nr:dynamin family protein [Treponema sp.]
MSELVEKLKKIEKITTDYKDVFANETDDLRRDCKVLGVEEMKKQIEALNEEGRLLNIGIIGRVKAGKSSLLNSMFFEGKPVLPTAATPMTASLTVLSYGDQPSATVEYYTAQDIDDIQRGHDKFAEKLSPLVEEKKEKLRERAEERHETISQQDIEQKAERQAKYELSNDSKKPLSDQFDLMKKRGNLLATMKARITNNETIGAADINALFSKLDDYVGAKGTLMPFTKSVEIHLPIPALRNIQVVDTPGINDPVVSREARTEEYLKKCDVVFIVSPADEFLSAQDLELMNRLSAKEGVQLLYLVASKADDLLNSVFDESGGDLNEAILSVTDDLSRYTETTLRDKQQYHPKIAEKFDQLIEGGGDKVIITSAICHAMSLRFNDRDSSWDDAMKKVWENLSENYRDYFNYRETGKASLDRLSNVGIVSGKIDFVRGEKDKLIAGKQDEYLSKQTASVEDYRKQLIEAASDKFERVKSTDLQTIQNEKSKISDLYARGRGAIDGTFNDRLDFLKEELRGKIDSKRDGLFKEARAKVEEAKGSETKTRTTTTGKVFKKSQKENFQVPTVRAGAVKGVLTELGGKLRHDVIALVEGEINNWRAPVQRQVLTEGRAKMGDEGLSADLLGQAIRDRVDSLTFPKFKMEAPSFDDYLQVSFFGEFCISLGTLEGQEADRFNGAVELYLGVLIDKHMQKTDDFLEELEKGGKRGEMAKSVFDALLRRIGFLEQDLKNRKNTLDSLGRLKDALEKV